MRSVAPVSGGAICNRNLGQAQLGQRPHLGLGHRYRPHLVETALGVAQPAAGQERLAQFDRHARAADIALVHERHHPGQQAGSGVGVLAAQRPTPGPKEAAGCRLGQPRVHGRRGSEVGLGAVGLLKMVSDDLVVLHSALVDHRLDAQRCRFAPLGPSSLGELFVGHVTHEEALEPQIRGTRPGANQQPADTTNQYINRAYCCRKIAGGAVSNYASNEKSEC